MIVLDETRRVAAWGLRTSSAATVAGCYRRSRPSPPIWWSEPGTVLDRIADGCGRLERFSRELRSATVIAPGIRRWMLSSAGAGTEPVVVGVGCGRALGVDTENVRARRPAGGRRAVLCANRSRRAARPAGGRPIATILRILDPQGSLCEGPLVGALVAAARIRGPLHRGSGSRALRRRRDRGRCVVMASVAVLGRRGLSRRRLRRANRTWPGPARY